MKENTEPKPENTQDTSKVNPSKVDAFERACRLRMNGFSMADTASACSVSLTTIRRWENDPGWKDLWEQKRREIEESRQSEPDIEDDPSFIVITAKLLENFGLRELKDFCLAFRDKDGIIESPPLIQTLESVCANEPISALQLMNWLRIQAKKISNV